MPGGRFLGGDSERGGRKSAVAQGVGQQPIYGADERLPSWARERGGMQQIYCIAKRLPSWARERDLDVAVSKY